MQNIYMDISFLSHANKTYLYERFCTWPRFKKEAKGNSEMGYFIAPGYHAVLLGRAKVRCSVVCSIVFLPNPVKSYERCVLLLCYSCADSCAWYPGLS